MNLLIRGDAIRIPLPDESVGLVIGSPPYGKQRLYLEDGEDVGIAREPAEWVEWMLAITAEALRVSRGCVLWVVAGPTEGRTYQPIVEGLIYRWWARGGSAYRPCYWHRHGTPGSGGDQWFRANIETVACFKRAGALPWSDNTAMGHAPRCGPGGAMSHRTVDGDRVNRPSIDRRGGHVSGGREADGSMRPPGRPGRRLGEKAMTRRKAGADVRCDEVYAPPEIANPGNLIDTGWTSIFEGIASPVVSNLIDTGAAGGNNIGPWHAHENEAPFDVRVPEFFIRSLCPPAGTVLDPFSGSGTTAEAALKCGRRAIGMDLRMSQCRIARLRLERPHAPAPARRPEVPEDRPLLAGLD